ncbi:MAG TPA: hypothetical protein VMU30_12885 [Bacteroidota bacterium]|nr:hypothetical protein [Bacteroidota bacterium]
MSLLTPILSGLQLLSGLAGVFIDPANKRNRWIFIALLILIFGATVASDVQDARNQQKEQQSSKQELDSLLAQNNAITAMLNQVLIGYGNTKTSFSVLELKRSVEADTRLRTLAATVPMVKPTLRVEYFIKQADGAIIAPILRRFGFRIDIKQPVNTIPTNLIWVGNNVTLEETKQLAFALIRAGVELRSIERFQNGAGAKANLIQVGSDPAVQSRPVLTVEQVAAMAQL